MKKLLTIIIACLISIPCFISCVGFDVEEEYLAVCDSTTVQLNRLLQHIDKISCYDLASAINRHQKNYDSLVTVIRVKIGHDQEKMEFFNSIVEDYNALPIYTEAVTALDKKFNDIRKLVFDKWWIKTESDYIFMLDSTEIRFLNHDHYFLFSDTLGALVPDKTENFRIYIDTIGHDRLILQDSDGTKHVYSRASASELLLGRWICKTDRKWNIIFASPDRVTFPENKEVKDGTYSLVGDRLVLHFDTKHGQHDFIPCEAHASYHPETDTFDIFETLSEDKKKETLRLEYSRQKFEGPDSLIVLFENQPDKQHYIRK